MRIKYGYVNPPWAKPGGSKPEAWHWEYGKEGIMNKENKVILISSVLFLVSITAAFLIVKNPDSTQYTTVLSSSQNTNDNPSNQNNTREQSSEQKVITELLDSTSSAYGNRKLKKYSIVKRAGRILSWLR